MAIHAVTVPDTTTSPALPDEATFAASDILYWVGEGEHRVVVAVNWADTALAWGYRFATDEVSVSTVMAALSEADPRLEVIGTGFVSDITFIDTAAGMTDTLRVTPGNYWGSSRNGIEDAGMGQMLVDGDFEKWGDPAAGVVADSTYWEGYGWTYSYVYPMAIHAVTVPDTTSPANPLPDEATIAASDILYWVGEGEHRVVVAVNWADTALAWGYRFATDEVSVATVMVALSEADPRLEVVGTGFVSDITFIDTAAGMTDTLRVTPGNYWGSSRNGIEDAGMGQMLVDGDFEKWGDPAAGVVADSTYWEGYGWTYSYVYPMAIHAVTVPDTTSTPVVGIDNVALEGADFVIYPNPAKGSVSFRGVAGGATAEVISLSGQVMLRVEVGSSDSKVDISSLPRGAYFVRLASESGVAVRKLIVR